MASAAVSPGAAGSAPLIGGDADGINFVTVGQNNHITSERLHHLGKAKVQHLAPVVNPDELEGGIHGLAERRRHRHVADRNGIGSWSIAGLGDFGGEVDDRDCAGGPAPIAAPSSKNAARSPTLVSFILSPQTKVAFVFRA